MLDAMFTISPILVLTSRFISSRPLFHYHRLTRSPFLFQVYLFKAPFILSLVNHESANFVGIVTFNRVFSTKFATNSLHAHCKGKLRREGSDGRLRLGNGLKTSLSHSNLQSGHCLLANMFFLKKNHLLG